MLIMTEWTVITVLISIAGLFGVVAKPLISLTKSITKLDSTIKRVEERLEELSARNSKAHDALFQMMREHDKRIAVHDRWQQSAEESRLAQ